MKKEQKLRFFVDRGGTFTDVVALTGDGRMVVTKMLSQGRHYQKDPAVLAIEKIVAAEKSRAGEDSEISVEEVRLGTTVATNALLERKGEPTVLVTNKGFGDGLIIGYQNRPDIFALHIDRPPPLFSDVIELDCRFDRAGTELAVFPEQAARKMLKDTYDHKGIRSVAIVFMHGYKYPAHELACAAIAEELGYSQISVSHQSSGLIRYVSRGDTTLIDAYLTPPLRKYINEVSRDLGDIPVLFMKSDGGLAGKAVFSGKDAILSGPAGGVVGAVTTAKKQSGEDKETSIVGFDMGGTSTDVCYFEGSYERQMESTISGVRLRAPMLAVHTVAAGGGSILSFDGARFTVGPHSAGALPGPACYGLGGPAAVTDANLILGRLSPDHFPHVFGQGGNQALNLVAARERLQEIADKMRASLDQAALQNYKSLEQIADGYLTIATEKMARAIAQVSVQKGHDVRKATMVGFGGAGGQHACMIAERLGIETILLSPLAGVLSAYGIGATEITDTKQSTVRKPLEKKLLDSLKDQFDGLAATTTRAIAQATREKVAVASRFQLGLSYRGSDTTIMVDYLEERDNVAEIIERFLHEHKKLFGFVFDENDIIVENILVESRGMAGAGKRVQEAKLQEEDPRSMAELSQDKCQSASVKESQCRSEGLPWTMYSKGKRRDARLYRRSDLTPGTVICGPALITEATSTSVIDAGWKSLVLEDGCLKISRDEREKANSTAELTKEATTDFSVDSTTGAAGADPVQLELFNNIFMSVAEEMGIVLQKVSHSVNIKERLDFSCALFDRQGRLIANAPHMPVHLGSMGDSVTSLLRARGDKLEAGEAYVLNNPYNGGTHLPDLTVISPVFAPTDRAHRQSKGTSAGKPELLFFVGSRGHHADIGGITPGSMPSGSVNIEEEGVLLDNFRAVTGGKFLESQFSDLLAGARFPARNIGQNIKDLKAQIAANKRGEEAIFKLLDRYGVETVTSYMDHVRENAAKSIRDILKTLGAGQASCTMDDGSVIAVKVAVDRKNCRATVDFTGTSPQTNNNFNAPLAVTKAAVLYVFRTMVKEAIPLNDGCSDPLELIVPEGCMLNPTYPHAVVAGNVETSQVIVDTLYQALGVLAGSQGTMNNFTFGNQDHQYYETIAGGSGAGDGFAGTDAVQTHMTNSRLTDPEILEERFPVLLEEFSIRRGSGGSGRYPGGCGALRKLRFLEPMTASILSNRRKTLPPGLGGGMEGAPGANFVVDGDGRKTSMASTETVEVAAGQSILIETPGGGGFGQP